MAKAVKQQETAASLRFDYIQEAKYYYFRSEGVDEALVSALHRSNAMSMHQRMLAMGVELPSPEEIKAAARETWTDIKLHEG